jgi:hypothetical protein
MAGEFKVCGNVDRDNDKAIRRKGELSSGKGWSGEEVDCFSWREI